MQSLSVNSSKSKLEGSNIEKALHSGAKGLFELYSLYERVYDWISALSSFHYTIFSGVMEGFFNSESVVEEVKSANKLRRRAEDAIMTYEINALLGFRNEADLRNMLISGDLSPLKTRFGESYAELIFERLSNVEKYPLYIRTLIANNLSELTSVSNLLQSTNGNSIDEYSQINFGQKLKEFRHRYKTLNIDRLIQSFFAELITPEEKILSSTKKFEEALFSFGRGLGSLMRINGLMKPNELEELITLIALVAIYTSLYVTTIVKRVILKPFEIFKCLLLGFTNGLHNNDLLPKDTDLNVLLIDLKHPFNEIIFSLNSYYESLAYSNDNFSYACGKKGPMKVLEKLIASKSEYLMRKLRNPNLEDLKEAIKDDPSFGSDVGANISKDNPIAWVFALLNALEDFAKKLTVTLGVELGKSCRSFYDYVKSSENASEVTI